MVMDGRSLNKKKKEKEDKVKNVYRRMKASVIRRFVFLFDWKV